MLCCAVCCLTAMVAATEFVLAVRSHMMEFKQQGGWDREHCAVPCCAVPHCAALCCAVCSQHSYLHEYTLETLA